MNGKTAPYPVVAEEWILANRPRSAARPYSIGTGLAPLLEQGLETKLAAERVAIVLKLVLEVDISVERNAFGNLCVETGVDFERRPADVGLEWHEAVLRRELRLRLAEKFVEEAH